MDGKGRGENEAEEGGEGAQSDNQQQQQREGAKGGGKEFNNAGEREEREEEREEKTEKEAEEELEKERETDTQEERENKREQEREDEMEEMMSSRDWITTTAAASTPSRSDNQLEARGGVKECDAAKEEEETEEEEEEEAEEMIASSGSSITTSTSGGDGGGGGSQVTLRNDPEEEHQRILQTDPVRGPNANALLRNNIDANGDGNEIDSHAEDGVVLDLRWQLYCRYKKEFTDDTEKNINAASMTYKSNQTSSIAAERSKIHATSMTSLTDERKNGGGGGGLMSKLWRSISSARLN